MQPGADKVSSDCTRQIERKSEKSRSLRLATNLLADMRSYLEIVRSDISVNMVSGQLVTCGARGPPRRPVTADSLKVSHHFKVAFRS